MAMAIGLRNKRLLMVVESTATARYLDTCEEVGFERGVEGRGVGECREERE